MLGLVVVDDGIIADIGYGFVLLVDGGVLGVDVSKVGAVVGVDVAVPCVVVDGDVDCGGYAGIAERFNKNRNIIKIILKRTSKSTTQKPISIKIIFLIEIY